MTNQQVAEAFAIGETSGHSLNMFIEKALTASTVVYSYGYHWPIAVKTSEFFAYLNKDKYSITTSIHTGRIKRALQEKGIEIKEVNKEKLIAFIEKGKDPETL